MTDPLPPAPSLHTYRGWGSTKLHLALISMLLITVVYLVTGSRPDNFSAFCVAITTLAGLFSGAAAAERFAAPKV